MGSGTGLFGVGRLLTGLLGAGAGLAFDYPRAQAAAEESTQSQRDAIQGARDQGDATQNYGYNRSNEGLDRQRGANDRTLTDSSKNISDWANDYWSRGGQRGQANALSDDFMKRFWSDSANLREASDTANQVLTQIPGYQAQYGKQRETAYGELEQNRTRTDATMKEVRDTYDLEGMKAEAQGIKNDLMNVRGAAEIVGAVSPLLQQEKEIQAEIDSLKYSADPNAQARLRELQGQKAQVSKERRQTGQAIADQKTQQWAATSVELGKTIEAAKEGLSGALTALTTKYGDTASSILNSITASLNGETEFVNNAIRTAVDAGTAYNNSAMEANKVITGMQWEAINADEKVRALAMVDGPNSLLASWNANTQAMETNYTNNLIAAQQMGDVFRQMGLDMQFSFSPSFAAIAPYFGAFTQEMQAGFDNSMARQQFGLAAHAQSQNNALGWAGVGVSAMDAFAGNRGILGGINVGGGGSSGGSSTPQQWSGGGIPTVVTSGEKY